MYKAKPFTVSSPDAKAQGAVFAPYIQVLEGSSLASFIDEYGLRDMDMQEFYPQANICAMQSTMQEQIGQFSGELVSIGKESISIIEFPDNVDDFPSAFAALHGMYQAIHRNIPEEEGWQYKQLDEENSRVVFNAPYEPFAAYGYVWAIAKRYCPRNRDFSVYMEEDNGLTAYRIALKGDVIRIK